MEACSTRLIYPNPMRPSGVELTLAEDLLVTLKIFDIDGRELATLLENAPMTPGVHAVALPVQEYEDGVYFYQLSSRSHGTHCIETKKIIIAT